MFFFSKMVFILFWLNCSTPKVVLINTNNCSPANFVRYIFEKIRSHLTKKCANQNTKINQLKLFLPFCSKVVAMPHTKCSIIQGKGFFGVGIWANMYRTIQTKNVVNLFHRYHVCIPGGMQTSFLISNCIWMCSQQSAVKTTFPAARNTV